MLKSPSSGARRLAFAIVSIIAAASAGAQPPVDTQPSVSSPAAPTNSIMPARVSPDVQPPFVFGVDVGVAETDNVTLVPSNKVSQTIALADVDFDVKEQTRLLEADAKGNFSYLDYLQNAYGSELLGRADGSLRGTIVPGLLTWVVQDDFGQTALDPFTPTTPINLQNENYFSTGPDLALRFAGTEFLYLSARYARTDFQTSPFDSNRLQGSVAWGLQFSARSSVSLNVDTERVLFTDTDINTDYERTNAFLRYEAQGARTDLSVDLGATRLSEQRGDDSPTGPLARLTVTRKLSAAASITFTAGSVLTDASSSFSGLQSGAIGVVGAALAPITADNYTSNYASVGWQYVRNRTTFGVSARWEKDTYQGAPALDVTRADGEFQVSRQLSRGFSAQLLGRIAKTDYPNASTTTVLNSTDYDDDLIAAVLTWHYGRGLEVKLRAEHDARVSSGFDSGYKDNRAVLTVGYRPNSRLGPFYPISSP